MSSSTHAQVQRFNQPQTGSLRACGGYFHNTNMDSAPFGDYSALWPSTEEGSNGKSEVVEYDKLNQSNSSAALDDMVSRIIDDESQISRQVYTNLQQSSNDNLWMVKSDRVVDPFGSGEPDGYGHFNHQAQLAAQNANSRLEGRKLVGRHQHLSSSSTRSSDSAFDISLDNQLGDSAWSNAPKSEVIPGWPASNEIKAPDIWNERPTDLFVDTGQQWQTQSSTDYSKPARGDQLLLPGDQLPGRMRQDFHMGSGQVHGSNLHQSSDPTFHQQRFTAGQQPLTQGYQSQIPTAIPMSPAPVRTGHRFSPVSPGQPPIGSLGSQGMVGRSAQVSQLQRQAAFHQQQLRYGQNSPLTNSYTHLSRSPMSDTTSSLGSPASRTPDSPMFGPQPHSPLLHSPQTGAMPIAHHSVQQQQQLAEYLSSTSGYGNEQMLGPMMPALFYGPRGELMYDMVSLSPQQANKLQHAAQHQQYQHRPPRRTGPANDLHIKLEEAYDQFKSVEKERKKFEGEMARQNPGKKVSSTNNAILPRLPTNPSRVDRLIVDSLKEHSKVVTLLMKMEGLNEKAFHPNIHSAMDGWLDSTRKVQARRKEEIINATNRHRSGAPRNHDERDVVALAAAIAELAQTCRRARTALWCALQISWKPGFIPLGVMSKRAEVVAREKEALKEQQQLMAAQALATNRSASSSSSTSNVSAVAGPSLSSCSVGSSLLSGSISGVSLTEVPVMGSSSAHSFGLPSPFPFPPDGNNNLCTTSRANLP